MELRGATLYSTLQPCGMCTMASIWSKVGRVVYGAGRADVHAMYFEARDIDTLDFVAKAYRDDSAHRWLVALAERRAWRPFILWPGGNMYAREVRQL